jgi:hypothetical protein
MTTPSTSTRLKRHVSHRVSGKRQRQILLAGYRRLRAVRQGARRLRAESQRAAARAGRALLIATGRGQQVGVFVVVSPSRADAQTSSALMQSVYNAAATGAPVELLLVDYDADLDARFEAALNDGEIPGCVVRRFWRDAVPGAGEAKPRHNTAGLVAQPAPGPGVGEWRTAFYQSGVPALAVDESPARSTVEYFGTLGETVRRDEIDATGNLVRIVDVHPVTGQDVTLRYPLGDDSCWLSVWVKDGSPGSAHQHIPAPREFATLQAVQARWVDEVIAKTARPVVIAANPESFDVVELVGHKGSIRRALGGEVTTGQWRALVQGGRNAEVGESLRTLA